MTTTFDVVTDFNNTGAQPEAGNPFTYGTETSLNTNFTLFPNFQPNGTVSVGSGEFTTDGTLANYYISQAISGPSVGEVATGGPILNFNGFTVPNDVLMMLPGDPGLGTPELTVTRFTAPEKGVFDITGSFINLEWATVSVEVVVNGTVDFSGSFSGQSGGKIPFSISDLHLAAGATVDFIVDSLGSRDGDVLGLKAQITELPAPIMLDVVAGKQFTTLSGTAEAKSTVTISDGGKPVGTAIVAADGTWSYQASLSGKGIHSFTETSTDGSGNTISSNGVTLFAGTNQSLVGGSGDDVLIGAPGDTLTGGGGSNTFVFNPGFGKETIKGFDPSQDVIAFDHTLFTNQTVLSQTHDTKAGAVIVVDAHDTVTLIGVHVAQLQSSDSHLF